MTYRECYPADFSGTEIEDKKLIVGDSKFEIEPKFDQFPCFYEQEYFFEVIDKKIGTIIDEPAFITIEGEVILIDTLEGGDIGDYEVKICSMILNSLKTTEC